MFSNLNKEEQIVALIEQEFDLIVIGGGITGAGIALDATQRGMKVALFEKKDFSSGTSGKSTKLIHGGLRYLKNLEFSLVKEIGLERKIVHKNARHLVVAEKMLLPIIKKGSLNKFFTNIALSVYDFLAGVDSTERRKMLNKEETIKEEPLLQEKGKNLIGGGLYFEYRTDDSRLTLEIIKKANSLGAKCFNYTNVTDLVYLDEKVKGVTIEYKNEKINIKAKNIINATGPWVDLFRKKDNSLEGKRIMQTKGVHIVVKREKFPIKSAIYFDTSDKRMIFAIPREDKTYIGTTDTVYNKEIDKVLVLKEDVKYLIKAVNKMFPSLTIKQKDIESSWAGLRPLIYEDGKSASELSRKDEIFVSSSGLISITGGKLSGYRKMAERVVDLVRINLIKKGQVFEECKTENLKVSGGDFNGNQEIKEYIIRVFGEAKQIQFSLNQIERLVSRYGTNTDKIIEIAYNNHKKYKDNTERLMIYSEWLYGVEQEKTMTLSDFFIRRTAMLYFEKEKIEKHIDFISTQNANMFGLSREEKEKQKDAFFELYKQATNFD